jgi:NADH dehydrogenase
MALMEDGGHHVVAATRTNSPNFKRWIFFDLKSSESPRIPEDIDIVIHLAANTLNSNKIHGHEELLAAKLLIDHAKKINAKLIFLSSQASGEYAYSEYGRTKWKIENEVLAANGIVVRPGLVYGGIGVNGLFGTLVQIVRKRKILPSFYPSPNVQPIHVEDLCTGIMALLKAKSKIYSLAAIHPMPFKKFLQEIITTKKMGYRIFIPIPIALIKMIPFVVSRQSVIGGWVDRLLSLASTVPMHTQEDLNNLNLELRCLSIGINKRRPIYRRELLMEGRLFMLLIGVNLNNYSVRRYVKAIELCCNGAPLFLPILFLRIPFLFSLLNLNALPPCLVKADIQ